MLNKIWGNKMERNIKWDWLALFIIVIFISGCGIVKKELEVIDTPIEKPYIESIAEKQQDLTVTLVDDETISIQGTVSMNMPVYFKVTGMPDFYETEGFFSINFYKALINTSNINLTIAGNKRIKEVTIVKVELRTTENYSPWQGVSYWIR